MKELNFFSDYLAKRYGRKLYRIPLDLALGCPNREGGFGAGCAFCAEDGSRARHLSRHLDLAGQVAAGVEFARCRYGAEPPYIAYFQAFTSTFAPAEKLRRLYREALAAADFKVVIIGTRPDALPEPVLDLLSELAREYELWIELGVQSSHDRTLELIRRGHDFAATVKAANQLAERGINAACHVIAGLPGESAEDFFRTAERIAAVPGGEAASTIDVEENAARVAGIPGQTAAAQRIRVYGTGGGIPAPASRRLAGDAPDRRS